MLFIIGIAVFIAIALHETLVKISFMTRTLVFIVLFAGVVGELSFPLKLYPVIQKKDYPPVYQWLNQTNPDSSIIELPIYNWNMGTFTGHEINREYFGTVNFRKTVNGYTGFSPPPWQLLITNIDTNFPSRKTIMLLRQLGITYVIIHTDEYDAFSKSDFFRKNAVKNGNTIIQRVETVPSIRLVKTFKYTYVFRI
jgi:hypothetical protein